MGVEKDSKEALRWWRKAAEQGFVNAQCALANFLVTCPEERLRNGKEAVRWAAKACESIQSTNGLYKYYLGTRAAAHAEAGDFEQAVKYARMAIKAGEGGPDRHFIADITAQLKLYEAGQPYHQSADR
jgi:TPR repeat protein